MTDASAVTAQERIQQYRERARSAIERAARNPESRDGYLDLARSWNTLADAIERQLGRE